MGDGVILGGTEAAGVVSDMGGTLSCGVAEGADTTEDLDRRGEAAAEVNLSETGASGSVGELGAGGCAVGSNGGEPGVSGESVGSREGVLAVGVVAYGVDWEALGVDEGVTKSTGSFVLIKRTCNLRLVTVRLRSSCKFQNSCGVIDGEIWSALVARNRRRSDVETWARVPRSSLESLTVMDTDMDVDGRRRPAAGRTM